MKQNSLSKRKSRPATKSTASNYPRHSVSKALRIPKAIIDQNAGHPCAQEDAARFAKLSYHGPTQVEIGSALKFGFLDRPKPGEVGVTERAKRILRPKSPEDTIKGLREAVQSAPVISEVYSHYRGENLPDETYLKNTLVDNFNIPEPKVAEFLAIFRESLKDAQLLEESDNRIRILDFTQETTPGAAPTPALRKLEQEVKLKSGASCFVMMPFASPIGDYYETVYKPAIEKAGLIPRRADSDIFGIGKIMDQIWSGLIEAQVLVAELTKRNPNVFYELGLAHALEKPVVLVSSNEEDVPFDLKHIRVIYYDVSDPFWGSKLIDKVAENILSAIKNPDEAMFKRLVAKGAK